MIEEDASLSSSFWTGAFCVCGGAGGAVHVGAARFVGGPRAERQPRHVHGGGCQIGCPFSLPGPARFCVDFR